VGMGLGYALYQELLSKLPTEEIHSVLAGIALPNLASIKLHNSLGFTKIGTFPEVGFKQGRYIDVAW
jgi:L-amino acid N-acyltransferase YncA